MRVDLVAGVADEVTLQKGARTIQVYAPVAVTVTWLHNDTEVAANAGWPLEAGSSLPLLVPDGCRCLRMVSQSNTTITIAEGS